MHKVTYTVTDSYGNTTSENRNIIVVSNSSVNPDINIDTNGDGIANANIDTDGDLVADSNKVLVPVNGIEIIDYDKVVVNSDKTIDLTVNNEIIKVYPDGRVVMINSNVIIKPDGKSVILQDGTVEVSNNKIEIKSDGSFVLNQDKGNLVINIDGTVVRPDENNNGSNDNTNGTPGDNNGSNDNTNETLGYNRESSNNTNESPRDNNILNDNNSEKEELKNILDSKIEKEHSMLDFLKYLIIFILLVFGLLYNKTRLARKK